MLRTKRASDSVVAYVPHQRTPPSYCLSESDLGMGTSFGNGRIWVNTRSTGAVERVFSIELGLMLINSITVRYGAAARPLDVALDRTAHEGSGAAFVGLEREAPAEIEIHPAYQRCRYTLAGEVRVTETVFVPLCERDGTGRDEPLVYVSVELQNGGEVARDLRIVGHARLRGTLPADAEAYYDHRLRAIVARGRSRPEAVRIFGLNTEPTGFASSTDFGSAYDPSRVHALNNQTDARGDVIAALQVDVSLGPQDTYRCSFVAGVYAHGQRAASEAFAVAPGCDDALQRTLRHLEDSLQRGRVLTPDPIVNQGALWSKVNMRRVMADYPQGPAFTNEPGVSSNVVMRDAAWFAYGSDHFMPEFSRALLDKFAQLQYSSGKLPEYYDALDGRVEDYGLNINDDTPLFILAVNHHYRASGDTEWLQKIFPAVVKAARYIASQVDGRNLVVCNASDPRGNVWAIASWRNVIPLYSINGAVTEINAECVAALRAAGHLAENLAGPGPEAEEFFTASRAIREAMNRHLLNPENGLYYLNIDVDGNVHTDVTGDEIFPVMFRVCDEETGFRIISRLNSKDFWTPAGLRTASRNDPLYDPSGNLGLIGGVWPGLTWWYAFAAARYHADFMVKALRSSFEHYGSNPKVNNTVPGQFGEWFDGEGLINRGMRLSPWEPPRFLWAAVEGVCGVMLTVGRPRLNPLVPARWKWLGLRRLPYHGGEFSFFATRESGALHVYATCDVETEHPSEWFEEDISDRVVALSESAAIIALRREREVLVLIGSVAPETTVVPLDLTRVADPSMVGFRLRIFNSERDAWEPAERFGLEALASSAVSIEAFGFRMIELREDS